MASSRSSSQTTTSTIPYAPGALPFVGHGLKYTKDPLAFLEFVTSWGPVVKVRLGPLEAIVIRDPVDIERMVMGEHKHLTKDKMTLVLRRILGEGLLTSTGDTWVRHRKLLAPIFQPANVAKLGVTMVDVAERHARGIPAHARRELQADMTKLTADIVTRTLFAGDLGAESDKVGPALQVLVDQYGHGMTALFPALEKLPIPSNKRAHAALATLDEILQGLVDRARARGSSGTDLLSMLLTARDDAGTGLGDNELRDQLMTFFLAGHETTALTLTFALTLLAKNPDAERKLRDEINGALGDAPATAADVSRLPYTRAVVLETMRLYPPAWAIGRETLEELHLGEYVLPKGSQLWFLQWINHRDPKFFPEPLQFRPERWLDGLERTLPRFAYYPFGGGHRVCIGNHFAMMEAILAIATLLRRFRIRLVNPTAPLVPMAGITLRPKKPIHVIYEPLETGKGNP